MTKPKDNRRVARAIVSTPRRYPTIVTEALESRWLLSTYTVNTLSDAANPGDGLLSLRAAIAAAQAHLGADTITFSPALFSGGGRQTITLLSGELAITDTTGATRIEGPGDGVLWVSAVGASRVFDIGTGATASISGLTVTGGNAPASSDGVAYGGGIYNAGVLFLTHCAVQGNVAVGGATGLDAAMGGGIYSSGTLTITDSNLVSNIALGQSSALQSASPQTAGEGSGGAVYSTGTLQLQDSTVFGNLAAGADIAYRSPTLHPLFGAAAAGAGIYGTGSIRITHCAIASNAALGGVTTSASTWDGDARGGGCYATGTLNISGTTFDNNASKGSASYGGAIYSLTSATLSSSRVVANSAVPENGSAGALGGGIYALGGLHISSSQIETNIATGSATFSGGISAEGGGIFSGGAFTLGGSVVSANQATTPFGSILGGGIYSTGPLAVSLSTISDNKAVAGDGGNGSIGLDHVGNPGGTADGGGIWCDGNTSVTTSTISQNTAVGGNGGEPVTPPGTGGDGGWGEGGGIYISQASLHLLRSTIWGNAAVGGDGSPAIVAPYPYGVAEANGGSGRGGGVFAMGGTAELIDSTLASNSATGGAGRFGGNGLGGAIFSQTSLSIYDSTIARNTVLGGQGDSGIGGPGNGSPGAPGGGVGAGINISTSSALLDNSIVSTNQDGPSGAPDDISGTAESSSSSNLIGVGGGLANGVHGNKVGITHPGLSALGYYGGPTPTIMPLPQSPAIDAGDNSLIPAGITTDQRGFARIVHAIVDIGAVEVAQNT